MASFLGELKQRNVFRAGIAYLAAAWLLLQVADVLLSSFEAPAWIIQALILASALGFPCVLIVAWFYELTPQGLKAASEIEGAQSSTFSGRQVDFVIIALLLLAVGVLLVDTDASTDNARLPNSVAVLPFENLSPDADDAFFAVGMQEEIITQLSKLRALNVIARTSMLAYADGERSVADISDELNVETVLEGSVRYSGDDVRVAAQLIDAATNLHLWSDAYDGSLTDIFEIQADIAMSIANALEAEFTPAEQGAISRPTTDSPEAYALYLRALSPETQAEVGARLLDLAIGLDPEFAQAHALKALRYAVRGREYSSDWESIAQSAADEALRLDPTLGTAHAAIGFLHQANSRRSEAEQSFLAALRLSPNDTVILEEYGRLKRYQGDYEESARVLHRAATLDPRGGRLHYQLGITYRYAGRPDEAVESLDRALALNGTPFRFAQLGFTEAQRGNHAVAVQQLETAEALFSETIPAWRFAQLALAYAHMGLEEEVARLYGEMRSRAERNPASDAVWAMAHVALGEYDAAARRLELAVDSPTPDMIGLERADPIP